MAQEWIYMQLTTNIRLEFVSPENAAIFYQSFLPEFHDMPMKRSAWHIEPLLDGSTTVTVSIHAEDATAFRATVNSLVQFASIVERTLKLVEK